MLATKREYGPGMEDMTPDLDWITRAPLDEDAVARRLDALRDGPVPDEGAEADALVRVVACTDLTSLTGDETERDIRGLAARARTPLAPALLEALRLEELHTAAVCVYPAFLEVALDALDGSPVRLATVAAGFPAANGTLTERVGEVRAAARAGAHEIDAVLDRDLVRGAAWDALYEEIRAFREAAGDTHLKIILGTGELPGLLHVHRASLVCLAAGADFVKTSTGKEAVNATLPAGVVMLDAIRVIESRTGRRGGFKPAGGIRTADQALEWLALADEALDGATPGRFRIGASSLLGDVVRRLETLVDERGRERT